MPVSKNTPSVRNAYRKQFNILDLFPDLDGVSGVSMSVTENLETVYTVFVTDYFTMEEVENRIADNRLEGEESVLHDIDVVVEIS